MFQRRQMRSVLALIVVVTLSTVAAPATAVVVNFADANLEAKVRAVLGIPTDPITDTDMQGLGGFRADSSSISNIGGLEYGTNMTYLWLYNNQITNISAVAGLTKLNWLWLYGNQITDISPVAGLTNLTNLDLYNNQINDISAVAGLTNLTNLHLSANQISDISAVAGLTKLDWLWLYDNQISDISPVAGLTNLTNLYLSTNQIETMNLSSSNLSSLDVISIGGNPLRSVLLVDATLGQTTFNTLMDGGHLSYTGIAEAPGVLNLDMSRVDFAGISDLSAMYSADDLQELLLAGATNLDGSQISPLTAELDSLNWLDVTGPWDSFDAAAQSSLRAWNAVAGNTLVVSETNASADFNQDWDVDLVDINALTAVGNLAVGLAVPPANAKFDLDGDGIVGTADLDQWLTDSATINGYGSPYLRGDANLDGDVDVWALDGSGDAQVLSSNLGTNDGMVWGDGDFNGDGDVDVWAMDGSGDAQLLSSNLGSSISDVGPDATAGTAEAIYNTATGELSFDVGEGIAVIGIGSAVMYPGNVDATSIFGAPVQSNATTLAFFDTAGLPTGEDSVGLVLPPGLSQEDLTFSFTPTSGPTQKVDVTIVPEPSTIALLFAGTVGLLVYGWSSRPGRRYGLK